MAAAKAKAAEFPVTLTHEDGRTVEVQSQVALVKAKFNGFLPDGPVPEPVVTEHSSQVEPKSPLGA